MTGTQFDLIAHQLGADDRERWRASLQADPVFASPFLSLEWIDLVHRHRPATRILRVGRYEDDRASFLALDVVDARAVAVGVGLADRQVIAGDPLTELDTRAMLKRCRVTSLRLDQLALTPAPMQTLVHSRRGAPVIEIDGGVDAYYAELKQRGSGLEKWLQRKTRMAERELGECRFEHGTSDPDALDRLMTLKSEQYNRTGVPDRFAETWVRALAVELAGRTDPSLSGLMSVMYANDQPIAFHLGVSSASVLHWWMPTYDPDVSRYSPGALLLADLVRHAAESGIRELDLGHGEESYKRRFMTTERFLDDVRIDKPTLRRRLGALRRVYRRRDE